MDGASAPPDDDDDFKIKGAAASRAAVAETCTICLEPITERAVAAPCNHLAFDFLCLVSWLQEQSTCPLCKARVVEVQYDWRSPDDFKTYRVPAREDGNREVTHQSRRNHHPQRRRRRGEQPPLPVDPALERRRHVYANRLYALHIGSNPESGYTTLTPHLIATSPHLQSRAKAFLRRDLQLFPLPTNLNFLVEYILAILRNHDLRGAEGKAQDLLKDFLGMDNAGQLLHELEAWLRSPFERLAEWDETVQYLERRERRKEPWMGDD